MGRQHERDGETVSRAELTGRIMTANFGSYMEEYGRVELELMVFDKKGAAAYATIFNMPRWATVRLIVEYDEDFPNER